MLPLLKFLLLFLLVAAVCGAVAASYAALPLAAFPFDGRGKILPAAGAAGQRAPETLTLLTWNIAYGYGIGSSAHDYVPRDRISYEERLTKIAAFIASLSPDVVLLQEVDFAAYRSHDLDQIQFLRQRLPLLPYAASAPCWSVRYVPYPPWPFARHLRHVATGGVILSRFPITAQTVLHHAQPATNPFWYNAFYLKRYSQIATLDVAGKPYRVVNSHLEDADDTTRTSQARALAKRLNDAPTPPFLAVGGDLNAGPDENPTKILRAVPGLTDPARDAPATFPTDAAARRIDHLFIGVDFPALFARVPIEAETLSDHFPLLVRLDGRKLSP